MHPLQRPLRNPGTVVDHCQADQPEPAVHGNFELPVLKLLQKHPDNPLGPLGSLQKVLPVLQLHVAHEEHLQDEDGGLYDGDVYLWVLYGGDGQGQVFGGGRGGAEGRDCPEDLEYQSAGH